MKLEDQTREAFQEDFGVVPQTSEPKGKGYIELLVDNIVGLDNEYESLGESFGKAFNQDEVGTLKNLAVGAYEGAKEFVTSPIDTTKDIITEISDSVARLGTESLDGRLRRMYGIGHQEATDEQVTRAREAVIGDAVTASSLVPAARGVTAATKAIVPGRVQVDIPEDTFELLGNKGEGSPKNSPVSLNKPSQPKVPFFGRRQVSTSLSNKGFEEPLNDPALSTKTIFQSPIPEVLSGMSWPTKGKEGYQILSELRNSPSIRKSELDTVVSEIDPKKRYSLEGVQELIKENLWDTEVKILDSEGAGFQDYQRQSDLQDPEKGYFELLINSQRMNQSNFVANNQHFDDTTLAHSRFSVREDSSGENYLLVEELQSDLLQEGSMKPEAGVSAPPIKKIEESVKMTLGALIAEASKQNISRIVIPPFERVVAERFPPGSEGYKKALDPKSGFYKTYVKSTQAAIEDLEEEFGSENISSKPVDLNYATDILSGIEETLTNNLGFAPEGGWKKYLDKDFYGDIRNFIEVGAAVPLPSGLPNTDMRSLIYQLDQKGIAPTDLENYIEGGFEPFSEFSSKKSRKDLATTGTEIDFSGLLNSDYDLSKLRFAQGGLVNGFAQGGITEDEQMSRLMQEGGMTDDGMAREPVTGNEIPPGSLASEVRDDVPAQLSSGEYIVPADVLRFFGVRFFEDLRSQAKQGLMQMESEGRIGGTPVDAQGAPLEGPEEELTPEEEQMLQEALGAATGASAGTGMAMGGMVPQQQQMQMQQMQPAPTPYQDQATLYKSPMGMAEGGMTPDPTQMAFAPNPAFAPPTFDRTQFTSDTGVAPSEVRKYINPQTKEVRDFTFLSGISLSPIPEGFVPWTQELQDQVNAPQTPVVEPEKRDRKSASERDAEQRAIDLSMGRTGEEGQQGTNRNLDEWAKENYEAYTADPFKFGVDALNSIEPRSGISKLPIVGKIAGLGHDIEALNRISDARFALKGLDPNSAEAKELSTLIDKAVDGLGSNIIEMGAAVFAQGNNKYNAMQALQEAGGAAPVTPTTTRQRTGGSSSTSGSSTTPAPATTRPVGGSGKVRDDLVTTTPTSSRPAGGAGKAKDDVATPTPKPIPGGTGTKTVQTPSGPKVVKDKTATENRRATGGLVGRPTKKKTTK